MIASESQILFDKFEIIECLKKDDQSAVYLANHIYLGKKIILKILDRNSIDDGSIIQRFKREAKILAGLDHPHIIKVLDFGIYENYFYISFEYFESENLRYHINKDSFSYNQKLDLLKQLLPALHFAHSNNIIHRDIKPENILVNNEGKLKIGDFGLAYSRGENFVTSKASVVGTPAYMSPEQIQGGAIDERTDLFSTGVLFYELFTGRNLFIADDINSTINNILNFDYDEALESIKNELPDISPVLAGLLNPDPDKRFQSAANVLKLLDVEVTDTETALASPASKIKSIRLFSGFAVILIVLIAAVIFIWRDTTQLELPPVNNENAGDSPIQEQSLNPQDDASQPVEENKKESVNNAEPEAKKTDNLTTENTNFSGENTTPVGAEISYGQVAVQCSPWAYVYIDSALVDSTPLKDNIELAAGFHTLQLKNPSYPDFIDKFEIKPEQTSSLTYNLDSLFCFLSIKVHPWGKIVINNKNYGETPFTSPLILPEGKFDMHIINPKLGEFVKEIAAAKGDTVKVVYNFLTNEYSVTK